MLHHRAVGPGASGPGRSEELTDAKENYRKEQARLSGLPRAQRFEELIAFPTRHTFKVIGPRQGLSAEVRRALAGFGFDDVIFVERSSSGKRHLSLTFELSIASGAELDAVYTALEQIDGAAYVF